MNKLKIAHLLRLIEQIKMYKNLYIEQFIDIEGLEELLRSPDEIEKNWKKEVQYDRHIFNSFLNYQIELYGWILKNMKNGTSMSTSKKA